MCLWHCLGLGGRGGSHEDLADDCGSDEELRSEVCSNEFSFPRNQVRCNLLSDYLLLRMAIVSVAF